ncbi:hypothetical protein ES703_39734 [subsurface metagenome]
MGCGGTGSFVAEGLCRLLSSDQTLLLIDHDRVEPHNLRRQSYFEGDVGKFKSQALAERLALRYGRRIAYSVYPFDHELIGEGMGGGLYTRVAHGVIIGCVDNVAARREIAKSVQFGTWWIDAGNGRNSGQVLIGNADRVERLVDSFDKDTGEVSNLPMPSLQLPSLLIPPTQSPVRRMDCAEAVEADEQSPVINQAMATLVLEFVYRFMLGTLTWMGAYIDLESGTLQTIPAEPVTVARMFSVKVDTLYTELKCSIGHRYRLQERR